MSDAAAVAPSASPVLGSPEFEEATYRKITWHLLPFLVLCFVIAFVDRVNVGYAKLQMLDELKFSNTVYGFGAGVFYFGYFFFEVPSNIILHKVGARVWIARIMVTWGIISGCAAFMTTPLMFYTQRFLLGVAEAGFFPGIILYTTYWYPTSRRAKIVALFFIGIPASAVLGGPISGAILQFFHGFYGLPGWKWLFLIEAIPAIVVGVWTLFYLDSGIRQAKWLNEGEKQLLERRIAEEASEKKEHPSLLLLFKDPRVWVLAWIYFGDIVGNVGLLFWMPTIVKGLGVKSLLNVGLITALPYVVAIFLAVILGTHSDRHRERRWHIAGPFFATAVALIGSVIAGKGHPVIAITALSIAAGSVLGAGAVFWAVPTALLAGTAAAAGIAAINSVGNLGGFFGPYIVGWIVDLTSSTAMGMCVVAAVQVAVGLTTLTLPRTVNK